MKSQNVLGLIMKPTRQCNLRCSYCHDWRSKTEPMSFNVLATLTAKALQPEENRLVEFIWHGGEPLLMGERFYRKALFLQEEFRSDGQMVRNSLQTNGTLLTDEWCEFFKANNFQIGISIDGPETVHNQNRVFASGKGSFERVSKAIALLQKHQIPHGTLMVLNHEALKLTPKEVFSFFLDMGVKSFSFLPSRPDNVEGTGERPTPDYVQPREYVDFMKQIFDLWFEMDDPSIQIRELVSLTKALTGGLTTVCTLAGECLGQYYHVEANGDLYHCDKYLGDTNYHVGNIMTDDFRSIIYSEKMRKLMSEESDKIETLKRCKWFDICNGGCPHDRYIAEKHLNGAVLECCGMSELTEYIYGEIKGDLPKPRAYFKEESVSFR